MGRAKTSTADLIRVRGLNGVDLPKYTENLLLANKAETYQGLKFADYGEGMNNMLGYLSMLAIETGPLIPNREVKELFALTASCNTKVEERFYKDWKGYNYLLYADVCEKLHMLHENDSRFEAATSIEHSSLHLVDSRPVLSRARTALAADEKHKKFVTNNELRGLVGDSSAASALFPNQAGYPFAGEVRETAQLLSDLYGMLYTTIYYEDHIEAYRIAGSNYDIDNFTKYFYYDLDKIINKNTNAQVARTLSKAFVEYQNNSN